MARKPSVRSKNGYWYSEAGGEPRYYGRVDTTTQDEATASLWAFLSGKADPPPRRQKHDRASVGSLSDGFLRWVSTHRAVKNHTERKRHLDRFVLLYGEQTADTVDSKTVEGFDSWMKGEDYSVDYRHKHLTSLKAMYRWGVRKGVIRPCDPFARFDAPRLPSKTLLEGDLPTADEVDALIQAGDSFDHMGDLLRLYHATGARTYELIRCRVRDFDRGTSSIVLQHHKTATTKREGGARITHLSTHAFTIVGRMCEGKGADEPLVEKPSGGAYSSVNIAERFQSVRKKAGVRDALTLYSFRRLWISEALMAGLDSLLIARMAGTSVKMIEMVYGRFRREAVVDAMSRIDAMRADRRK